MKLPIINKFYSINVFVYSVVIKAFFTFLYYLPFWRTNIFYEHFDYLFWISCLIGIILLLSEVTFCVTAIIIPFELVLYKIKKLNREPVKLSIKIQLAAWLIVLLSFVYLYWFDTYCYPIIEQQLMMD